MKNLFEIFQPNKKSNILILGIDGMLGYDVFKFFKNLSLYSDSRIGKVIGIGKNDLHDLQNLGYDLPAKILGASTATKSMIHIDYCINCIAHTNTLEAQYDDAKDYAVNAYFVKKLADACAIRNIHLIHISTDYVFSEKSIYPRELDLEAIEKKDSAKDVCELTRLKSQHFSDYTGQCLGAYLPFPLSNYGKNKLIGELFIKESYNLAGKNDKYLILRTSWLYGMHNNKSFVHKFLYNFVQKSILNVDDKANSNIVEVTTSETSIPTSTLFVCNYIYMAIQVKLHGTYHCVPLSNGGLTRYDFAQTLAEELFENVLAGSRMKERFSDFLNKINAKYKNKYAMSQAQIMPIEIHDGWHPYVSTLGSTVSLAIQKKSKKIKHWSNKELFLSWKQDVRRFINEHANELVEWIISKLEEGYDVQGEVHAD